MSGFSRTGAADAIQDAGIAEKVPMSRNIFPGIGLSGGGDLSEDIIIDISAFSGLVSKSFDPGSRLYAKGKVLVTFVTYDVGNGGSFIPVAYQIPAASGTVRPRIVFEFSDGTSAWRENPGGGPLGDSFQGCTILLMNDAQSGQPVNNDGKVVRKIKFAASNADMNNDFTVDIGAFRLNAYATPRGGGSITVI